VPIGQPWAAGDVIGVALDADAGELSFWRNGAPLGVAFSGLRVGGGVSYYPAVSLSQGERIELNLGAEPLLYPLPGFSVRLRREMRLRAPALAR
jgi:Kip1 ubiquitination-promoting complex protein 1